MLNVSGITLTFNQPSEINGAPIGTLLQVGSNNRQDILYRPFTYLSSNLRMLSRQVQLLAVGVI